MSEQVLSPKNDSNLEHDLDETAVDDTPPEDITQPGSPVELRSPLPEDVPQMVIETNYEYHRIDGGMVEVSLALAALVFTVATISSSFETLPERVVFLLLFLGILTNIASLWFLAVYCVQQGIIEGDKSHAVHNPLVIFHLLLNPKAGVYCLLSFCLFFLLVMFVLVLLSAINS